MICGCISKCFHVKMTGPASLYPHQPIYGSFSTAASSPSSKSTPTLMLQVKKDLYGYRDVDIMLSIKIHILC
ncbi:unnamed protein product [Diplocarpon coronariae]